MKNVFRPLGRFYKKLRLQTKVTFTHLIVAVIPMLVIGIFFYTRLYDMIISDTIRTEQNASSITAPLIEDTVSQILDSHRQVTDLTFYRQAVSPGRKGSLETLGASSAASEFTASVSDIIDGSLVTDVKFYMDIPGASSLFSSSPASDIVRPISNATGTYWYGIFNGDPTLNTLFCPSFYLSSYEINNNGDMAYITKASVICDGERTFCYLAVYFSQDHLDALLKDNLSSSSNVAYIINDRDSIAATSDSALSGTYHFSYDEVQDSFMSSNNFIMKRVLGEDVYAGFYSIAGTDWYMVVAMPSKPMISKSLYIMAGFVLVYITCIIVALCIATMLSHSITNRLFAVIDRMAKSRTSPPVALPPSDTQDEIGDLISSYNYMTRVINELMDKQAKAAEELRIAEFNSLQAQINPHFLYNTMDMINWLSQQGRSREVSLAVQKLSRFYKLTLSRKQRLSTIADELEHASIYVQLQNMRFHDMIDFLIDVPDYLMEYAVPKLTFQPVIENSILHGILEKPSKIGSIVIAGWVDDADVVLLISDNGVGISEEKLKGILTGSGSPSKNSGTNIAVYNIHRRLKLMFGSRYGLSYSSTRGKGTDVEIRIPALLPADIPETESLLGPVLTDTQFSRALHLLSYPDLNIYDIAQECGYDDPQEFFREFNERFGCTPEEYRQQIV